MCVLGAVVLVAIVILLYDPFDPGSPAVAADWVVDPEADLDPATTSVAIQVTERECASGRSAEGRIEVEVVYRPDEVQVEVGVRPRSGEGVECPSNPITPYVVQLSEPLGDRSIDGERPFSG